MQTFLPDQDFTKTARILDKKRLFKQLVEAGQILNTLEGRSVGWKNHPAVRMWVGHESGLRLYQNIIYDECIKRGFKLVKSKKMDLPGIISLPDWIRDDRLCSSHRGNLLRKDPEYYGQFGWAESPDLPYWWPINE